MNILFFEIYAFDQFEILLRLPPFLSFKMAVLFQSIDTNITYVYG